jgi:hypothetical protein
MTKTFLCPSHLSLFIFHPLSLSSLIIVHLSPSLALISHLTHLYLLTLFVGTRKDHTTAKTTLTGSKGGVYLHANGKIRLSWTVHPPRTWWAPSRTTQRTCTPLAHTCPCSFPLSSWRSCWVNTSPRAKPTLQHTTSSRTWTYSRCVCPCWNICR